MPNYTIHVPNFKADNHGVPVTPAHDCVAAFIKALTMVAGGCTVVSADAVGYWLCTRNGCLIADRQTIVEVMCSGSLWHHEVLPLVINLKIDLNQRSLYVTSSQADVISIP